MTSIGEKLIMKVFLHVAAIFAGLFGWGALWFELWNRLLGEQHPTAIFVLGSICLCLYTPTVLFTFGTISKWKYRKQFERFLAANQPGLPRAHEVEFCDSEDQGGFPTGEFLKGTIYFSTVVFEVNERVAFNAILKECKKLSPEFRAESVPRLDVLNSRFYNGAYRSA